MENVMNSLLFWQFKFIGMVTNRMQDLKRPKQFHFQIPIVFGFDIFAIQPNFFAGSITSRLNSFIIGLFLQFLGIL